VAEPRIRTLSGQEGILVSGERMPVWWIRHEGEQKVKVCTYKQIGTTIKVVPTVQRDGSVEMKVTAEFSEPSSSDETLFDVSHTETTALIRSGQTFVMASDSMNQKGMKTLVFVTANVIEPVCSQPKTPQAMTFADIVRLSKRGISDDIIIRQMDITNARFRLSVDDILELNSQGVSDNVIRAMQERRPARVSPYVIK
jgi:hypothetical protein